MSTIRTRCYIVPLSSQGFPVEADYHRIAFTWSEDTIAERMSHGLSVAPGVRVAVLAMGDHWHDGHVITGALLAVQTTSRCTCGALGEPGQHHVSPCPASRDHSDEGQQQ
jgi:hypothetical protein